MSTLYFEKKFDFNLTLFKSDFHILFISHAIFFSISSNKLKYLYTNINFF
jgi:protein associated with RNAse G/E